LLIGQSSHAIYFTDVLRRFLKLISNNSNRNYKKVKINLFDCFSLELKTKTTARYFSNASITHVKNRWNCYTPRLAKKFHTNISCNLWSSPFSFFRLFGLGLDWVFLIVEEDEAEDKDSDHHAERRRVVRSGREDEPLVL